MNKLFCEIVFKYKLIHICELPSPSNNAMANDDATYLDAGVSRTHVLSGVSVLLHLKQERSAIIESSNTDGNVCCSVCGKRRVQCMRWMSELIDGAEHWCCRSFSKFVRIQIFNFLNFLQYFGHRR